MNADHSHSSATRSNSYTMYVVHKANLKAGEKQRRQQKEEKKQHFCVPLNCLNCMNTFDLVCFVCTYAKNGLYRIC